MSIKRCAPEIGDLLNKARVVDTLQNAFATARRG